MSSSEKFTLQSCQNCLELVVIDKLTTPVCVVCMDEALRVLVAGAKSQEEEKASDLITMAVSELILRRTGFNPESAEKRSENQEKEPENG